MAFKPYFYDNASKRAKAAKLDLERKYGRFSLAQANVLVALGGDGLMLEALSKALKFQMPIYGMNLGHLGARLNKYNPNQLEERIFKAIPCDLNPLKAVGIHKKRQKITPFDVIAWNEVGIMRSNSQASHLLIQVENEEKVVSVGDGHIIATALGSTSYNESAGGHLLGWRERLLTSTSICSISPAIRTYFNDKTKVHITPLDINKRPVKILADNTKRGNVIECDIFMDHTQTAKVLYDESKICEMDKRAKIIIQNRPLVHLINKMQAQLRRI